MKLINNRLFFIFCAGILSFALFSSSCSQKEKIKILEEKIARLKEENVPLRFKILSRDNDLIKVAVKFYDTQGNVIDRSEKQIKGSELSFDFYVLPVNGRYLAFPYKIFSDKIAPADGESLIGNYDREGFPQIYYFKGIDPKLKESLAFVFEKVKTGDFKPDDKYFGNMVHDVKEFQSYETDQIYKIVTHTKGGIEVVED
jgi:hypothetical protein